MISLRNIKSSIKKCLPQKAILFCWYTIHPQKIKWCNINCEIPYKHLKAIRKIQKKEKIRCVFLALFDNTWKYDRLYQLMLEDDYFEPLILICPIINYGKENMVRHMKLCYNYYSSKGYKTILSYNEKTDKYIDLRKDINPDIIFYTNPYKGLIDDRYFIDKFEDKLTVYVPYFIQQTKEDEAGYNLELHNKVWRYYVVTELNKQYSHSLAYNKGKNVKVVGYPGIEKLIDGHKPDECSWKEETHKKKRIIWAPHQTIQPAGNVNYSTFLFYYDFMLNMAEKYKDNTEWVFKPHPLLINRLYELWGKEKTDNYYKKWKDGENTNYIDGDYTDLFISSDAMIHDCGSFVAEYLYCNKPVMRPLKEGTQLDELFSEFGLECLKYYYFAKSKEDIENFIKMVIAGEDPMMDKRTKFVNDVLMPKGGMPSDLIIKDIKDSIKHCRVYPK